jgi:hypothetical protein
MCLWAYLGSLVGIRERSGAQLDHIYTFATTLMMHTSIHAHCMAAGTGLGSDNHVC